MSKIILKNAFKFGAQHVATAVVQTAINVNHPVAQAQHFDGILLHAQQTIKPLTIAEYAAQSFMTRITWQLRREHVILPLKLVARVKQTIAKENKLANGNRFTRALKIRALQKFAAKP